MTVAGKQSLASPRRIPKDLLQICLEISPSCKVQGLFEDLADRQTFMLRPGLSAMGGFCSDAMNQNLFLLLCKSCSRKQTWPSRLGRAGR